MIEKKTLDFRKTWVNLIKYILLIVAFVLVAKILVHVVLPSVTYTGLLMYIMNCDLPVLELSLVIITAIYVILTHHIVVQGATDRKIAFAERKLEKFYYPLFNLLEYDIILNEGGRPQLRILPDVIHVKNRNSNKNYNDCITHQYLMNEKIKIGFEKFFKEVYRTQETEDIEHIDLYKKLKNDVETDIEILKDELNNLVKSDDFECVITMLILIVILFAIHCLFYYF